jgi:poly(hydroxyalkanoate) granule-associated protein
MNKPKFKTKGPATSTKSPSGKSIMESAQQIWLAGLGAFAKAQEEGSKLFETLVREGVNLEKKTRSFTSGKVEEVRGVVETGVSQVRERTQETWDKLEAVFEDRVSRALNKLGVPGRKDLQNLFERIDELNREVKKISPKAGAKSPSRSAGATVRRAKDDLADLATDIEEAQLAAKKTARRSSAKTKKSRK